MAQRFNNGAIVRLSDKAPRAARERMGDGDLIVDRYTGYSSPYLVYRADDKGRKIEGDCYWVKANELTQGPKKSSKERFEAEIKQHQDEIGKINEKIATLQSKIEYLGEIGSDEYVENEFKAYSALTIIGRPGMSKLEQAKALAVLIKG